MNSKSILKELFSDYYPISGSFFEISLAKNYNNYCFVEGSDDRWFYSNICDSSKRNTLIFNNSYFVYQSHCNNLNIVEGKKRVLRSYDLVNKNNIFNKLKDNMIFIVDKDLGDISENDYNVSITKYYAFENYFLLEKNLKIIFKLLYLNEKHLSNFIGILNKYINKTNEYYKYSYLVTYYYELLKNNRLKRHDEKDILLFMNSDKIITKEDFNNFRLIDYKKMNEEIAFKKQIINSHKLDDSMFSNNSIYTIKGHHLYTLLEKYLKTICNVDLKDKNLYSKIVRSLYIDMDFVNILGKKYKNSGELIK